MLKITVQWFKLVKHVSLYINIKSKVGLFGRVRVQVTSVANC